MGIMNRLDDSKKYNLTAIVLVYNGEPYLERCIQSLVDQTLDDLEILLINDASTDDSLSICRKFEKEYDNVFVIDQEKNCGLASNANLGIRLARGEYIILVDNDDIIPPYAYEKLYKKAKEVDADVSTGKAYLFSKYQMDMPFFDKNTWIKERVITDINQFPELFHDAFYWNSIFKKDLLIENDIFMHEEIKVYADISFVHRVYSVANKISIIPDCVYLWRKRLDSLSRTHQNIPNFNDRVNAYEIDLDYLSDFYNNYFNVISRRALMPIKGILLDDEFEEVFYDRLLKFFKKGQEITGNIYNNKYKVIENIYTYLIVNECRDELRELLQLNLDGQSEIINDNGKSYWKLPQFRNPKLNIPDELFEIRYLQKQFVKIEEITVNDKSILFNNIELPKHFELMEGNIVFRGRTKEDEIFDEKCSSFKVEKVDNYDRNLFNVEVPLDELNYFEYYTIYFGYVNKFGIYHDLKLSSEYIQNIHNGNGNVIINNDSKYNVRVITQRLDNLFNIDYTEDELIIDINSPDKIKRDIQIYLKNNTTFEKVFLSLNDSKTRYHLKWKFFLDKNTRYTFFMKIMDNKGNLKKDIKMHEKYFSNFDKLNGKTLEEVPIKFYKTKKDIVKFKSN